MAPNIRIVLQFLCIVVIACEFQISSGQNAVNSAYWLVDSGTGASDIDSSLFTHLFCAFADVNTQTNQITIPQSFSQFTSTVQRRNPSVRTLLSIGGAAARTTFLSMVAQPSTRKTFIDSSISVARNNGFSGLDLDWEYPRTATEMSYLSSLLDEWRSAVTAEATRTGRSPLLLTAAFYYAPSIVGPAYDSANYPIQSIVRNLDWVNAMAYDFYDPSWYRFTQSHSALYDPSGEFSGSYGIQAWIRAGVPARKLVLGMPFYGKAWRLVNAGNPGFLVPANGPAFGDYGDITYREVRRFITDNGARQGYNSTIVSNYCYAGTTWIGYDDVESIAAKVSYARNNGLLGYFAWQVSQDLDWTLSRRARQTWGVRKSVARNTNVLADTRVY